MAVRNMKVEKINGSGKEKDEDRMGNLVNLYKKCEQNPKKNYLIFPHCFFTEYNNLIAKLEAWDQGKSKLRILFRFLHCIVDLVRYRLI